jgi:hypothetical protein
MKWRVPPGLRTRRTSERAASMSGIVHIVQVDRALSKLSSGNGSDCPSSPDLSTGTCVAARRLPASFQPMSAGSTAATRLTLVG